MHRLLTLAFLALSISARAQDTSLHDWLIEGEGWKPAITGFTFADGICTDAAGDVYFSDVKAGKGIYKHDVATGKTALLHDNLPGISGMQFGPDGRLYATHNKGARIIAIDAKGTVEVLLTDVKCNDLVVTRTGFLYFTETPTKRIHLIRIADKSHVIADEGHVTKPNGITVSTDEQTLAVSDYGGKNVWTWVIAKDGTLSAAEPYMTMDTEILSDQSGGAKGGARPEVTLPLHKAEAMGDGMTTESTGRYFVTTAVGVQVFDSMGRHSGTLALPTPQSKIVSCEFAGKDHDTLYLAAGDTIYSRKLKVKGYFGK